MIKFFSTVQYLKIDSTLYTVVSCQLLISGNICNVHTDLLVFLILTSEEVLDSLTSVTDNVVVMPTGSLEFQCSRVTKSEFQTVVWTEVTWLQVGLAVQLYVLPATGDMLSALGYPITVKPMVIQSVQYGSQGLIGSQTISGRMLSSPDKDSLCEAAQAFPTL